MNISIHIDADSTANELIAVSNFTRELALGRGAPVSSGTPFPTITVPADEGDLREPEVTAAAAPAAPAAGTEPPKRRRRSKEEIAAENARVAAAEAEAQASNEAGLAEAQAEVPATETPGEPAAEEPDAFETVTPATGKNYTEAEVQQIATVVARTHGADKVKNKIAELGAQRIAGLEQGKLNELGAYLEGLK